MKTDRLLLVAIVAVMAAVVGYLFFSDDAAPAARVDGAGERSGAGDPGTAALGEFQQQKQLQQARAGCLEFELPAAFRGRSAEDVAAFFQQPSLAYRVSAANGAIDGFAAGRKVYVPETWVRAYQAAVGGALAQGSNPNGADVGGPAKNPPGPGTLGGDAEGTLGGDTEGVVVIEAVDEKPARKEIAKVEPAPAKPTASPSDPSEKQQPWAFLMNNRPVDGGATAPAPRREARAVEASASNASVNNTSSSVASRPTAGRDYRVQQGDTVWKIAEIAYGKGARWKEIAAANQAQVGADGTRLRAGMTIRIP